MTTHRERILGQARADLLDKIEDAVLDRATFDYQRGGWRISDAQIEEAAEAIVELIAKWVDRDDPP